MSIAISEEHRALAKTVADFLTDHQSRAAARSLLTAEACSVCTYRKNSAARASGCQKRWW